MFDFIRRWFAGVPDGADGVPGTVTAIEVRDYDGAGQRGRARLVAQDAGGTTLLAADVTTGIDPSLAAGLDTLWGAGGVAEGDYLIETVLPARTDEAGVALFGPHPMLRLRAMTDGGVPRSGRTVLLVHGGPAGRPTDGSIRMDDADLAALLALLPAEPGRVRVRVVRSVVAGDGDPAWDDDWGDDDAGPYYGQLYDWTETVPGAPPYPDIPAGDEEVGSALAGLGYGVLPDDGAAAPDAGTAVGAGTADAGLSALSGRDEGWAPAGGAYGP